MKIFLLKNNVLNGDALNKGIYLVKQYASSIGLTLDFTVKKTDKQFTSQSNSNEVNTNGYIVVPAEIFQEALKQGMVFSEDTIACLVFDWNKIQPQPTNPAMSGLNMQIPENWYNGYSEVFAEFFLHELSHYFASKNNVPDLTHNYDPAFSQLPRYQWYLHLIQQFINSTPTVILTRTLDNGTETIGVLTYKNFNCKTLELPYKNNQRNISCIPTGTYQVKYTFSWKFMKYTYEIQNVPNRAGIRIHSANFVNELLGCIALGNGLLDINKDGLLDVINSRNTIKAFENIMGKKPFTLVIK